MGDKNIACANISEAAKEFFKQVKICLPKNAASVNVRFDRDIINFFKREGSDYQTKMNAVLRDYMENCMNHPQVNK